MTTVVSERTWQELMLAKSPQEMTLTATEWWTHPSEQNDPNSIPDCTIMQQEANQEPKKIPKQPHREAPCQLCIAFITGCQDTVLMTCSSQQYSIHKIWCKCPHEQFEHAGITEEISSYSRKLDIWWNRATESVYAIYNIYKYFYNRPVSLYPASKQTNI